jgi:uncharacterized membrane protein YedE/YeeE
MDFLYQPWPWYVSGIAIALVMLLLLLLDKNFGVSGNLRTLCTICGAGRRARFFDFDWKAQRWNLWVLIGTIAGGFLASNYMSDEATVDINPDVVAELNDYGFSSAGQAYLPTELFALESLSDPKVLLILVMGGFLVGFGARYAGGCTSGHAISGLSDLQLPSLIAVIGFFIGGLTMIHLLFPFIF